MGGPFSSKKVTTVSTSASPLVDREEEITPFYIYAMLKYILGGTDMVGELLDGFIESPYFKMKAGLRYGKNYYVHGLPKFNYMAGAGAKSAVENIIESQTGHAVEMRYYRVADWNLSHRTWEKLVSDYGYDSHTNKLQVTSDQVGHPCYLKDFFVVYSQQTVDYITDEADLQPWGARPQFGRSPSRPNNRTGTASNYSGEVTPFAVIDGKILDTSYEGDDEYDADDPIVDPYQDAPMVAEYAVVTYEFRPGYRKPIETGTFQIDHGQEGAWRGGVVQVEYSWTETREVEKTSTNSQGEQETTTVTYHDDYHGWWSYKLGTDQPMVDAAIENGDTLTTAMFPIVPFRVNRTNLTESLKDTDELKSIEKLTKKMGLDYHTLSEQIHENDDIKYVEQAVFMFGVSMTAPSQLEKRYLYHFYERVFFDNADVATRGFKVRYRQQDFDATISCSSMVRVSTVGSIGAVGTVTLTHKTISYIYTVRRHIGNNEYEIEERTGYRDVPIISKQVSRNIYVSYEMDKLKQSFLIYKDYNHIGEFRDDFFLVPLDNTLVEAMGYNIREKNELYLRAGHFVFNARRTQKIKWYERSFFKIVLTIAAVAITIWTGGATWQAIAAAATLGAMALAITVITLVVKALVIQYGFKFLADQLGAEFAFFLAVAAAVVGGYQAFQAGSVQGAPWANELLAVSGGLSQGIQNDIADKMKDLQKEARDFTDEIETKEAELERGEDLLESSSLIDPMMLIEATQMTMPGEDPDFFYQRSVHSGNIGVLALDAPMQFVDNQLRLPYQGNPTPIA